MFYICRDKGRRITVQRGHARVIETPQGPVREVVPAKRVEFIPISGPAWVTRALPERYGRNAAEGCFDSSGAKYRENLTEQEADEFLVNHKDYGIDFVAIDGDGKPISPSEWNSPMRRSDPFLTASGEGKYCELCDKQLDVRGVKGHVNSAAHLASLEKAEKKQLSRTRGARA